MVEIVNNQTTITIGSTGGGVNILGEDNTSINVTAPEQPSLIRTEENLQPINLTTAGTQGTRGFRGVGYISIFSRSPSQPTTPVSGSYNNNTEVLTLPNDFGIGIVVYPWVESDDISTLLNTSDQLWESTAKIIDDGTSSITPNWSTPALSATGPAGPRAVFDQNNTTAVSLPVGSTPTVQIDDTNIDAVTIQFGIPTGTTGITGDKGDQGDQGNKGDAGVSISTVVSSNVFDTANQETDVTLNINKNDASTDVVTFSVPKGSVGDQGTQGDQGININTITGTNSGLGTDTTITTTLTDPSGNTTPADQTFTVAAGAQGNKGDGFTGGSYDTESGITTFTSDDGLGFTTADLRGAGSLISITAGDGLTGGTITTTGTIALDTTAVDTRINLQTGANLDLSGTGINTDDLSEGTTNLYYTDARTDTRINLQTGANLDLSNSDTGDLTEGTNLYFTDERVDDRVDSLIVIGTGLTKLYDDVANTLTITPDTGATAGKLIQVNSENKLPVVDGSQLTNLSPLQIDTNISAAEFGFLDGVTSSIQTQISGKEDTITPSTTSTYYRGDKTFQPLETNVVTENGNLYFTDARFNTIFNNKTTSDLNENTIEELAVTNISTAFNGTYRPAATTPTFTTEFDPQATESAIVADTIVYEHTTTSGLFIWNREDSNTSQGGWHISFLGVESPDRAWAYLSLTDPQDAEVIDSGTWNLVNSGTTATELVAGGGTDQSSTTGSITSSNVNTGNLYFTNSRTRNTISGGTGVTYNSSTGVISIPQEITTTSSITLDDLTLTGNLSVSGTTTTNNQANLSLTDVVIRLSEFSTTPTSNDGFDRGIHFNYFDTVSASAKDGFWGWDNDTSKFTFIPDVTETSGVFSGTVGTFNLSGTSINELSDVDTTGATADQILILTDGEWKPGTIVADISNSDIDNLKDVSSTTPIEHQVLVRNDSNEYEPQTTYTWMEILIQGVKGSTGTVNNGSVVQGDSGEHSFKTFTYKGGTFFRIKNSGANTTKKDGFYVNTTSGTIGTALPNASRQF